MAVINDVYLNYVCIKNPALEYEKSAVAGKDHLNKEFKIEMLLPVKTYKALKAKYKSVKSVKEVKQHTAEGYEKRFKVAPPEDSIYIDSDGEYNTLKMTKMAYYKLSGDKTIQPKVMGVKGTKTSQKDSEGKPVSLQIEVGNGSFGRVQFIERAWKNGDKKGISLDLVGIQVANPVEYASKYDSEFEFEFEDDDGLEDEGFVVEEDSEDTQEEEASEPDSDDTDW